MIKKSDPTEQNKQLMLGDISTGELRTFIEEALAAGYDDNDDWTICFVDHLEHGSNKNFEFRFLDFEDENTPNH